MQEIIKFAFLGILGVLLATLFKGVKQEYSLYVSLVLAIILFGFGMHQVELILPRLRSLWEYLGNTGQYLGILLKVIGITYVCEFGAGICRDAGYQSIAGQIEVLGKLSVMLAGVPILFAVIEQIENLL